MDAQTEVGQVRASDRDGTGDTHALDDRRVDWRDGLGEGGDRLGGGCAGEVDVLLDGDRDPMEHTEQRSGRDGAVSDIGRSERVVAQQPDDGVDGGVHLVDASEVGFHHLSAGDLATGDHPGQFHGTPAPQLVGHRPTPSYIGMPHACRGETTPKPSRRRSLLPLQGR